MPSALFPLLGAFAGAIAGSFLATLAIRWPRGESILDGRSHCDGCGAPIPAWRLIPLASYALQRGRCARCRAAIDRRHPAMEAACTAIGAGALAIAPGPAGAAGALFGWLLATLAVLDRDHFWLPDALVLPLGLFGLAGGAAALSPALPDRLIGMGIGGGLLALIAWSYRRLRGRDGMGAGDPKLAAAIGAWLGWAPLPWVLLGACALGLGWIALKAATGRAIAATDRLPLGSLLALAAWPAWCVTAWGG